MPVKISSAQMRAARALLRWSALDLAKASKVGVATIRRAEVLDGEIPVTLANESALRQALEAAGVEFTNGEHPGVRLTTAGGHTGETAPAPNPKVAANPSRRETAKATEKKQ
jgi:hypothetical protein